jgi:hypothetical protein
MAYDVFMPADLKQHSGCARHKGSRNLGMSKIINTTFDPIAMATTPFERLRPAHRSGSASDGLFPGWGPKLLITQGLFNE